MQLNRIIYFMQGGFLQMIAGRVGLVLVFHQNISECGIRFHHVGPVAKIILQDHCVLLGTDWCSFRNGSNAQRTVCVVYRIVPGYFLIIRQTCASNGVKMVNTVLHGSCYLVYPSATRISLIMRSGTSS